MVLELDEVVESVDVKVLETIDAIGNQYRTVILRNGRNLECFGEPMDALTAYVALLDGRDIYAADRGKATVVASLHRDAANKPRYFEDYHSDTGWKYDPYQYRHYHLGRRISMTEQERDSEGHLCFGKSASGEIPKYWVPFNNKI